jgi:hypothetical protein
MYQADLIALIHNQAQGYGRYVLTGKEFAFIESVYKQAVRSGFTSLSVKQGAWLNTIAAKLEAAKGKAGYQIVAERVRGRLEYQRRCYEIACFGY